MKTITIRFPEVKVKMDRKDITFDTLEEMIYEIGDELKRKATEQAIKDIDEELRKERPKGELENKDKRSKYFLTRYGDIRYKRRRYKEKKTGSYRYLLDEKLNIKKDQRISSKRAQLEIYLASISPYREAEEQTALIGGYTRSHEAIRQLLIKEGEKIKRKEDKSLDKIKNLDYKQRGEVKDKVYIESDATFIKLQKANKGGKKGNRSIDVKVGIGYTDTEDRYKNGRQRSKRLKDKFVFTGVGIKGRKFMERLSYISEAKLALFKAKRIFLGGDGAEWIRKGMEYFMGAKYLLCLFHLNKNITELMGKKKKEQVEVKKLLKHNKIAEGLKKIKRIIKKVDNNKEKKKLKKLYKYISNNQEGIENTAEIKDKDIKRTGAIESNIDKIVAHRMKKQGMSWSIKGARSILKIQEMILNGKWKEWWYKRRDERIEVRRLPEPLSAKQVNKRKDTSPFIEAEIPAFRGPEQDKTWVGVLKELRESRYLGN